MKISELAGQIQSHDVARGRYAILGDIHANLEALTAVLYDATGQQCTHFACVGDLVGYNANPCECLAIVRDMGIPCVRGNHDEFASIDSPLDRINPRAAAAIVWTREQLPESDKQWLRELKLVRYVASFSLVHATLDGPQKWGYIFDKWAAAASLSYQNTAVCFFGHTHLPLAFMRDTVVHGGPYLDLQVEPGRKYLVNVGSVGEPRDGQASATYVIYDLAAKTILLRRVPFDVELTEAKVRAAGLPQRRGLNIPV
jgi:predicted phosphodiesterase